MKKILLLFVIIFITNLNSQQVIYSIDVTNYQDDLFHVTVEVEGLSIENGGDGRSLGSYSRETNPGTAPATHYAEVFK